MKRAFKKSLALSSLSIFLIPSYAADSERIDKVPVQIEIPDITITDFTEPTVIDLDDYFKAFDEPGPTATINLVTQSQEYPIEIQLYSMYLDENEESEDYNYRGDPMQKYLPSMDSVAYFSHNVMQGNYDNVIIDYAYIEDPYFLRFGFLKVVDDDYYNLSSTELSGSPSGLYPYSYYNFNYTELADYELTYFPFATNNEDNLSHEAGTLFFTGYNYTSSYGYTHSNLYSINWDVTDNTVENEDAGITFARVINEDDLSILEDISNASGNDIYTYDESLFNDYNIYNIPLYDFAFDSDNPWALAQKENLSWIESIEINTDESTPISEYTLYEVEYNDDYDYDNPVEGTLPITFTETETYAMTGAKMSAKIQNGHYLIISPFLYLSRQEEDDGYSGTKDNITFYTGTGSIDIIAKTDEAYMHAKVQVTFSHETDNFFDLTNIYQANSNYFIPEYMGLCYANLDRGENSYFNYDNDDSHYFYSYELGWLWFEIEDTDSYDPSSDDYWLYSYTLKRWLWSNSTYLYYSYFYVWATTDDEGNEVEGYWMQRTADDDGNITWQAPGGIVIFD